MATHHLTNGSNALWETLMGDHILPGFAPSYELCKLLYTDHPLGAKIARLPIDMAMSEPRHVRIENAPDDEAAHEFTKHWNELGCDQIIQQVASWARVYGMAVLGFGATNPKTGTIIPSDAPIDAQDIPDLDLYFNVWDPLNTAGSLVLNQDPNQPNYMKTPSSVTINGQSYRQGRFVVLMNEDPVYLDYESSAYGYSGRSCFKRCIYPLRSYMQGQVANSLVAQKAGLVVAKVQQPGSVASRAMKIFTEDKADMLRLSQNGEVLTIGQNDTIESLNLLNVDKSLHSSRQNIIEDIAAAAGMPSQLLNSQTLAQGFGEGTEDAKMIAQYIRGRRQWMAPVYQFCDQIVMRRAWNSGFINAMRDKHPESYGSLSDEAIFRDWKNSFSAHWPSEEAESNTLDLTAKRFSLILDTIRTTAPLLQDNPNGKDALLNMLEQSINSSSGVFDGKVNLRGTSNT